MSLINNLRVANVSCLKPMQYSSCSLLLLRRYHHFVFLPPGSVSLFIHCKHHRTFLIPSSPPLHLSASLILPYERAPLFALIADIPSYPSFLPYLHAAHVTEHSEAIPIETSHQSSQTTFLPLDRRRWPRAADLHVAWKGYERVFRSQVKCIPERSVEAISAGEDGKDLFEEMRAQWTLKDLPTENGNGKRPMTEVQFTINARFQSALMAMLGQAAAPRVAGLVMNAFERRAQEVLGVEGSGYGERMLGSKEK